MLTEAERRLARVIYRAIQDAKLVAQDNANQNEAAVGTVRWLRGEAPLEEMLEDPIVHLVMERDGLDKETVQSVCLAAAGRQANNSTRIRVP